jgi:DNA repair protein RecO (recombination protein O)
VIATDRGLVLRGYKLGDTSKIVCLLGARSGRLRLVAHGGRKGRFGSSLEPGNEVDVVYSLRPGRDLGHLREAALRHSWLGGMHALEPLGTGLAVLELLDRLVPEGAGEPGLVEQAIETLAFLGRASDRAAALHLFYAFELGLLRRFGLGPDLDRCARCGATMPEGACQLDIRSGELRCRGCSSPAPGRMALTAAELSALRALDGTGREAALALATRPRTRRAVGLALHRLLATHLERYRFPRSLLLLKKVDRYPGGGTASGDGASFPPTA